MSDQYYWKSIEYLHMKPSMTNFDAQEIELRGSIRPLKNNYVRMKYGILIVLTICSVHVLYAQELY
jgi:hypothetical protein